MSLKMHLLGSSSALFLHHRKRTFWGPPLLCSSTTQNAPFGVLLSVPPPGLANCFASLPERAWHRAEPKLTSGRFLVCSMNLLFRQWLTFVSFFFSFSPLLDGRCYGNDDFKYPSSSASLWVAITKLAGCIAHLGRKNNWQLLCSVRVFPLIVIQTPCLISQGWREICSWPLQIALDSGEYASWKEANSVRTEDILPVSRSVLHGIARNMHELNQTHPKKSKPFG